MRRLLLLTLTLACSRADRPPGAGSDAEYITSTPGPGRFPIVDAGRTAPIVVASGDHPGVIRAAHALSDDIERVGSLRPPVVRDSVPAARDVILVGTLGRSPLIDQLVRRGKLDVSATAGRWETFQLEIVERPFPEVDRAFVIAGSDKRGTIFGIYDLSASLGVSPWYWWADVPVQRRSSVFALPGRHSRGTPAVRYRGIFINDEAPALADWAHETFGGFNGRFYERVFELILRLKGNFLWPAMWGRAFYLDDPANPQLADDYGVVIGTSHHEPMMRAHVEWSTHGSGEWNYERNRETLRAFWREGIRRMGSYESLVTIGMRGDGDEPMSRDRNIDLLQRIVADQRALISEVTGKQPQDVPQVWALYKEVQEYYDAGMTVPEDVTLLFADDNWGNIRRLPRRNQLDRPGGFGVYYHFDYVGGPRNYKWINTNPIARVWEQMHLAYRYGATRIWIVNVGDIKPMELPASFFLDYAWNPDAWSVERLADYPRRWAEQQFGPAHAKEIGEILTAYSVFNGRRKPELLSPETYSLIHYREAERVRDEYNTLAERARQLAERLPAESRDAFYQLVLHPAEASANLNDLYVTVAQNRLYARQGRAPAAAAAAERARALFARDAEITDYFHTELAGGKWNHMMSQTHIGYTSWQQPPANVMPEVVTPEVPARGSLGVAIEGSDRSWPGDSTPPALPPFHRHQSHTPYLEVFNRGGASIRYQTTTSEPWLRVEPASGTVVDQQRLVVTVDWSRVPPGTHEPSMTVAEPGGAPITIGLTVHHPDARLEGFEGFIADEGYVSMEAAHFSRAVTRGPVRWQVVPDLGRTGAGVTAFPVTGPSMTPGRDTPHLEYRFYTFTAGPATVHTYLSPTLNFTGAATGLRYAVSIDDEPPRIVDITATDDSLPSWERSVANNIKIHETAHRLDAPGAHVLRFWLVDPGVVLQKIVVDLGGLRPSYLGPPESPRRPLPQRR